MDNEADKRSNVTDSDLEDGEIVDSDDDMTPRLEESSAAQSQQQLQVGQKRSADSAAKNTFKERKRPKLTSTSHLAVLSDEEDESNPYIRKPVQKPANEKKLKNPHPETKPFVKQGLSPEVVTTLPQTIQRQQNYIPQASSVPITNAPPVYQTNISQSYGSPTSKGTAAPSGTRAKTQQPRGGKKHTALPPPTDPFWGHFKVLLATPDVPPLRGRDMEQAYPVLPNELAEEYGLNFTQKFKRDDTHLHHPPQQESHQHAEFDPSAVSEGHVQPAPPLSVPNVGFGMPQEGTAAENSHMTLMTGTTSPPETGYANHAKGEGDPLSEDFPLLDGEGDTQMSLKDLVFGTRGDEEKRDTSKKVMPSLKKKLKAAEWHRRQAEKEKTKIPKSTQPCKFFISGSCRAGEECPYSHNVPQREKKREICKYFISDSCIKGQDCTYYHGPIPCKYFNSPNGCSRGDQCRYSHEPLNEETSGILQEVLKLEQKKKQSQVITSQSLQNSGVRSGPSTGHSLLGQPPVHQQPLLPTTLPSVLGNPPSILGHPPSILGEPPINPLLPPKDFQGPGFPLLTDLSSVSISNIPPLMSTVPHQPSLQAPPNQPPSVDPRMLKTKQSPDYSWEDEIEDQPLFKEEPVASNQASFTEPRKPQSGYFNVQEQKTQAQSDNLRTQDLVSKPCHSAKLRNDLRSDPSKYPNMRIKSKSAKPTMSPKRDSDLLPTSQESIKHLDTSKNLTKGRLFQMPASLNDPSHLDKPLDPVTLFGSSTNDFPASSAGHPSGIYGSGNHSSKPAPLYGEIDLQANNSKLESQKHEKEENHVIKEKEEPKKNSEDSKPVLPYYALFDTGLGGSEDLEINSAFGEL